MRNPFSPPATLAISYLIISTAWILGSDYLAAMFFQDSQKLAQIQAVKGVFFVTTCALLIFLVSKKYYYKLQHANTESKNLIDKYDALHEVAQEGIVDYDLLQDCATINEKLKQFLGLDSLDVENFSLIQQSHIHPSDYKRVSTSFRDTLVSSSNTWQAEFRCLWRDGTYHEVITRGYLIRNDEGSPLHFICTMQDVSELRIIQAAYYEQRLKSKLELGRSIIQAQEQERNRWAVELHDNVCQLLTVVKLYLSEKLSSPEMIARAQKMVEHALNEIRQLSASVKPPEFGFMSLGDALRNLIDSIKTVKSFHISLHLEELKEELLDDAHKLMIYRVVQEQLNNIIKHAENPENIIIRIGYLQNKVDIQIVDDGKGFDTGKLNSGIGLRNIKSRLQTYSGKLKINSAPGKGCTLNAQFFLN